MEGISQYQQQNKQGKNYAECQVWLSRTLSAIMGSNFQKTPHKHTHTQTVHIELANDLTHRDMIVFLCAKLLDQRLKLLKIKDRRKES